MRRFCICLKLCSAVFALAILFAPCSPVPAAASNGKTTIVLGKTDTVAPKAEKQLGPIIEYLASQLGDVGIEKGELAIPQSGAQAVTYLKEGKIDITFASPFPTIKYQTEAGTTPILLGARHGMKEYGSLIFARKDSGFKGLHDLRGKVIAFEDPTSTSEYFLPRYSIEQKDMELVELKNTDTEVPAGKVGFLFAGDELNITSWVFHGKVAAGALSSALWNEQKANPAAYREKFEVIYESVKVPRLIVSVGKDLDPALAEAIKNALLRMADSSVGAEALQPYSIDGFHELPPGLLDPVREMYKRFSGSQD